MIFSQDQGARDRALPVATGERVEWRSDLSPGWRNGKRRGLKIPRGQPLVSSILTLGIIWHNDELTLFLPHRASGNDDFGRPILVTNFFEELRQVVPE